MLSIDFVSMMTTQFGGRNEDKRAAYMASLNSFCNKCPEGKLQDVYDYCVSSKGFPSIQKIFKYAEDNGFIEKKEYTEPEKKWYYKCNGYYEKKQIDGKTVRVKINCSELYSSNSGGCPNCGSTSATVVIPGHYENGNFVQGTFPEEVKIVKELCYLCKGYAPDGKGDGFRIYGPVCSQHGLFNSPDNMDETCRSCKCRNCCIDSREYKYNRDNYFFNENGNRKIIEQDWLKDERKPGVDIIDVSKISEAKRYKK